jgi:hypothetical protein
MEIGFHPYRNIYLVLVQMTASRLSMTVIDKTEYWFLDILVEMQYPLRILTDPNLEAHLNRRGHGLAYPDLVDVLERMFQNGCAGRKTHPLVIRHNRASRNR